MEITEQWIGKAAGGGIFKEARALLKRRKVISVTRKEGLFQGTLDVGSRPMKLTVQVLGPHEVRNHCRCALTRRTGALCEHATALMLAGIGVLFNPAGQLPGARADGARAGKGASGDSASPPRTSVPAVPLAVRLSPRFPQSGTYAAVHIHQLDEASDSAATTTDSADQSLTDWLVANTGQVGSAMLSLPEEQWAEFYRVLAGHRRLSRGDDPLTISVDRLRPALQLDLDGGSATMKMLTQGLISVGSAIAEWNPESKRLVLDHSDSDPQMLAQSFSPESAQAGQTMKTAALIKMLPALAEMYQLPEDLGGLDVRSKTPEVELEISGSTRALQAQLHAVYSPERKVQLSATQNYSNVQTSAGFPFPDDSAADQQTNRWWVRDPDAERSALGLMIDAGFQAFDASGVLFLRGEDEVLDFLTVSLPSLRKKWKVLTEAKLGRVESRVERIVPRIELDQKAAGSADDMGGGFQGSSSGEDWLACDVAWQCGGQTLSGADVRKLLMSGSRSMDLPRGGKAVISHFDAEVMEGFMLDADPKQESGKYLIPSQQAAYLNRLRGYYDAGGDDAQTTPDDQPLNIRPILSKHLLEVLRDYQLEGVQWLYNRVQDEGGALLADDMGLGKTLQALSLIELLKQRGADAGKSEKGEGAGGSAQHIGAGPALVVCPATLLGNWRDEAEKFVPDLSVLVMHGPKRKDYFEVMEVADIIITSYALLDRDCEHYKNIQLGAVILDEASAIRNPDTLAAKAVRQMKAPARVAITGTPVENGVRDLWSIFQFIMPGYLGGREDFRLRYELPCQAEVPDRAAMQRLRWRTEPMMLRRTKSRVAKELPPKMESVVWCDPSPMQKDHYQSILRHGTEKMDRLRQQGGEGAMRMQMLTVLLRLRQTCCDLRLLDDKLEAKSLLDVSSKLARLMELLEEAQRGGHRVLVFSQFTSMLALIRDELDRQDIDFCYLDGSTQDRSAVVNQFQKPTGPPVFLISLKAGGYGLTLTAADTVVLFDPWWNPAVEAQAADRIHRIGQTKPATIYKLITRGTVEEKILRLQQKKRAIISAAMGEMSDETAPMMSGLSETEMKDLLS